MINFPKEKRDFILSHCKICHEIPNYFLYKTPDQNVILTIHCVQKCEMLMLFNHYCQISQTVLIKEHQKQLRDLWNKQQSN